MSSDHRNKYICTNGDGDGSRARVFADLCAEPRSVCIVVFLIKTLSCFEIRSLNVPSSIDRFLTLPFSERVAAPLLRARTDYDAEERGQQFIEEGHLFFRFFASKTF